MERFAGDLGPLCVRHFCGPRVVLGMYVFTTHSGALKEMGERRMCQYV